MPRRKPKVIRHITTQDSDSEELPEVRLEPSDTEEKIPEDEEEQMDPPEENGEEEAVNGEIADDDVSEVVDEEKEEEEKKEDDEEDEVTLVNGDGVKITTDEKGNEVLPDGTLIIQPEEVSSENDSFSGPEFKKNTKKPALSDLEGTYKCSSCHEQLNHNNPKQVAKHDHLGVLLCRSCHKYLQSEFDIDDEGSEEQCTWCGEGGKLVCCDSCPKAFCRSCIKTNLGRAELSNILADEEEQWLCYVCNPAPLNELIEECKTVFYHLKNPKKDTKKPKSKDGKSANKNKKKGEEEETADIMKVMQLLGDKSSSKNLLENLVKGRSPKGLKKTLDFFKNIKKISEGLEKRIKNELDDDEEGEGDDEEEEEGVTEDKSSAESSEVDKDKKKSSKAGKEEDEKSDAEKSKKKKGKEEGSGSEEDDKKSTKEVKKTKKDKKDGKKTKPSSTSPSEDDVPGTSSGSVKGNKSNRKGRRSLFKAQQKEKTTTSSDESDESSEPESSVEDSDWEEESGVKDRRRRRGSKKGKAGGKLSAKRGRADSSDDDSEDDDDDKKKKKKSSKKGRAESSDDDSEDDNNKKKKKSSKKAKGRAESSDDDAEDDDKKKKKKEKSKSKGGDSDPEIQFPKKKKKDLKADSSNAEQSSSDEEGSKKKKDQKKKDQKKKDPPKGTTKSKKSKDGDISLSSDYDEESEEESEESSADEIMQKIKKAKQNAVKGTMENKQDLESDAEDKIAERLLMEEAEEDDESGGSESDSDLDDAKKKRDKRNKKGGKKRKKKSSSEDDGDDKSSKKKKRKKTSTDDEDDSEEDSKSKEKKKGRRKKNETSDSEDDSDNDGNEKDSKSKNKKGKKGSKKKKKHHLLEVNISASESDEEKGKGKKKKKRRRKKMKKIDDSDFMTSAESGSDSDVKTKRRKVKRGTDGSTEDEVQDRSYKKKKGKRRRIKDAGSTSSDSGSESGSDKKAKKSGDDSVKEASGSGSDDQDTPGKKRVMIRQVLKKSKLLKTTLEAERAEKDRRDRIKKRREEMYGEMASPAKSKKVKELVLEYNDDKEVVLEVDKRIVKHLKPHQVDGVQFLWESTFECVEKKNEPGGGAILAHCMGLGKTLQIITYLHTVMSSEDLNVKRAIVVCPLNTVLNWVEEFNKWLPFDDSIDVYEITSVRNNESRADMLEQWHEEGGVLVMGYSMYRILALNKFKKKRLKRIFHETLVNPGPCVVVCDEGHMLKNSQTAIAKALNSVKTRRRICLTGTPLQNNLIEYHCMVDFVKPNLLGSQKEYKNRFVNPITNGQCSDSNRRDVRIMKHRAHILHDLLAGCVQRKDYSVITKFLPPKHEYVLSIRLSPKQVKLYEVYLGQYSGMKREDGEPAVQQRSASVFADYQALMRIWTHPQVLKLNTIREENKAFLDMDGFVTSEDDTDGSSIDDFLDDRKSSDSGRNSDLEEVAPVTLTPDNKSRATRASRRQTQVVTAPPLSAPMRKPRRNGIKIDSSDEEGGDGHKSDSSLEIIKTWKSRSRTLDPENDDVAAGTRTPTPTLKRKEWYDEYFDPVKDAYNLELSGKLNLLFEILRHCETVGEKILVFSQSLLSLDLIEDFLEHLNKQAEEDREKGTQDLDAQIGGKGAWIKGEDYFRMDGSTSAAYRHHWCEVFNEVENMRARLFLISTKAGSLGINLVGANRVIIFDASWNPSHDTQSIFRVYRFGQERPVFIYRFVAQGTMEEKIYERQIAKQSLSQRVVDEHQIERHFSAGQLQELYTFTPDRLDDPDREDIPIPKLPKDHILADLLEERKEWIVKYHEQDSLLENKIDEELNEEERKAAWDEYNKEKEGRTAYMQQFQQGQAGSAQWLQHYGMPAGGAGATPMMLQKLYEDGSSVLQAGQNILGQQQQQYRALTLNGYNPYGWPSGAYAAHSQAILMSQYQALQQQRQRNLQMMPQGQAGNQSVSQLLSHQAQQVQVARQQQAANSYSNSMSTLLSRMSQQNQQATAPLQQVTAAQQQQVTAAQQQQATAAKQQQATAGGAASAAAAGGVSLLAKKPASQLFEALKKTAAEQQKQPQPKQPQPPPKQQNGGGKV